MSATKPQTRTLLTSRQRTIRIEFYNKNPYPSLSERHRLVQLTDRTSKQIQDWFSNRRHTDPKLVAMQPTFVSQPPSPSSSIYLAIDHFLPKSESLSPIQTNEDYYDESFDNINKNNKRTSTVKRPMNGFLLWARGERKRVSSDGYGVSQTSLSKLLGETWRRMSVEEKQPFLDMAETLKRQHHIDHPGYRFKPKQRSSTANRTKARKQCVPDSQQQLSTMNSSSHYSTSSSLFFQQQQQQQQQQQTSSFTSDATPYIVQSTVLAMCQAIAPSSSSLSSDNNNDWFSKLIDQRQSVIVVRPSQMQTSPILSRRAVRIQIINKHDDIAIPPPPLLPMTPSPLSSSSTVLDESTSTLIDYLSNTSNMFNIPNNQPDLMPVIDDIIGYETLQDLANNQLMDLDQPYNNSGWIDTPLSNFATNSTDINTTPPYLSYDFLSL
ncbi:unnamed protein product [Rotaria sp. Silwood2]|nr:unnamed protein product [Rotaria sp. Silwood2]CAF2813222.1 unnamed protein product [Rotaria sp. Silwood2]CAF3961405.1 unnamed protein product [Rotaria sp. Silwood2]